MAQFNPTNPNYTYSGTQLTDGGYALRSQPSEKTADNFGRQKVTIHQNVYEADFEYGSQPLRWEALLNGTASVQQLPSLGGVQMQVGTGINDIAIRQSRPYHRYQPGKTMYMAANANFGAPVAGNFQRVGFFDDANGAFFEQGAPTPGNPYGMYVAVRSDAGYSGSLSVINRIPLNQWNGDQNFISTVNWLNIQMIWIEYAWYGAGTIRFGLTANSEQYILHTINTANSGQIPWARTGNLPVRYEIRNSGSAFFANTTVTSSFADGAFFQLSGSISASFYVTSSNTQTNTATTKYVVTGSTLAATYTNIAAAINASSSLFNITASASSSFLFLSSSINLGNNNTIFSGSGFGTNFSYVTSSVSQSFVGITSGTTFYHFGVSVVVEGGRDGQRGFTYSYGMNPQVPRRSVPANQTRFPLLSIQNRPMGTQEYSGSVSQSSATSIVVSGSSPNWTNNQWLGRGIFFTSGSYTSSFAATARITGSTGNTLNIVDVVTGLPISQSIPVGSTFTIGQINRGQILPLTLVLSADSLCYIELISSVPGNPVILSGSNFQPLAQLGSAYSFGTRDVNSAYMVPSSGEVVYAFTSPAGGSGIQIFDLSNFFPLYTNIRGNVPDLLTIAVTTAATGSNVGAHIVAQEAMS